MINLSGRRSPLSGLWACLLGGAVVASVLVIRDPIMRFEDCSNYGGNGNASAFDKPADLWFPLALLGWTALVILEQTLPVTWRHRSTMDIAVRAVSAVFLCSSISCCLFLRLAVACH